MKTSVLKIILALLPIFVVAVATLYLTGFFGTSLPEFAGERLDGRTFTRENLRPNVPLVICYIDVTCEDCQSVVKGITEKPDVFSKSQVIIISPQGKILLSGFQNNFELKKYPFITLLDDRFRNFDKIIKAQSWPTVLLYNGNQRLVRRFDSINNDATAKSVVDELAKLLTDM